ncbi:MAG: hypothetical protein WC728_01665 [Elusimicrobiota bacterium]
MAKPFPENVALKQVKCPNCGEKLKTGALKQDEDVIRAECHKDGCGFSVDLFWLGDAKIPQN